MQFWCQNQWKQLFFWLIRATALKTEKNNDRSDTLLVVGLCNQLEVPYLLLRLEKYESFKTCKSHFPQRSLLLFCSSHWWNYYPKFQRQGVWENLKGQQEKISVVERNFKSIKSLRYFQKKKRIHKRCRCGLNLSLV